MGHIRAAENRRVPEPSVQVPLAWAGLGVGGLGWAGIGKAVGHIGSQGTPGPQKPTAMAARLRPGPHRDWLDRGADVALALLGSGFGATA